MKRINKTSAKPDISYRKSKIGEIKYSVGKSDLNKELDKRYTSFLNNPQGKDWDELKKELL